MCVTVARRMADLDDTAELLASLSVMMGMIMEDEVTDAISVFPKAPRKRMERFGRLETAGNDIAALAAAAAVIVRRRS